jgi:hypothetical protein
MVDPNHEVNEFLKGWGIDPEGFSSAMITIDETGIVTVAVVHRIGLGEKMRKHAQRYHIVELKNE